MIYLNHTSLNVYNHKMRYKYIYTSFLLFIAHSSFGADSTFVVPPTVVATENVVVNVFHYNTEAYDATQPVCQNGSLVSSNFFYSAYPYNAVSGSNVYETTSTNKNGYLFFICAETYK